MSRGQRSLIEQLDATPVTFGVLIVYLTMAVLTDPLSPPTPELIEFGAAAGALVQDGEPWRLLTCAFLHGGLLHLLLNTFALFWLGPTLEERLGSLRFLSLYAVSAVGGSVTAMLFTDPLVPVIGGSGALFGMMGAALASMMRQGRSHLDAFGNQGARSLLSLIAMNLAFGFFVPFISNSAHIGGLLSGFVWTYMFLDRGRAGTDRITRVAQGGWLALLAALTLYVCVPVLRWDYQQRRMLEATSQSERMDWAQALGRVHTTHNDWIIEAWGPRGRDVYERWLPGRRD